MEVACMNKTQTSIPSLVSDVCKKFTANMNDENHKNDSKCHSLACSIVDKIGKNACRCLCLSHYGKRFYSDESISMPQVVNCLYIIYKHLGDDSKQFFSYLSKEYLKAKTH